MFLFPGGATVVSGFEVLAVDFDGTNDYMTRGAALTGATDGKAGTLSVWINQVGQSDGTAYTVFGNSALYGQGSTVLQRNTSNKLFFRWTKNTIGHAAIEGATDDTHTGADAWKHILYSWDGTNTHIYINDTLEDITLDTKVDHNIDYDLANWGLGSDGSSSVKWKGYIAEFWLSMTTRYDLSSESNRRKFIDAAGKPVDLGADGSNPGVTPIVYQSVRAGGAAVDFDNNLGSGGDFNITGTLALAGSSPSD